MENGHGNRNGFMDGLIKTSSLQRDVFGFGLKMPPIESSSSSQPCKRNTPSVLPPPPPPPHHPAASSSSSSRFTVFNGDDGSGGGGGPNFSNTSYQMSSSLSDDIYYVAAAGLGDAVSATTFLPFTTLLDPTAFKTTTSGEVGMSTLFGKAPVFTASQRQELEKQTIICKYMMASLPVPPQLLSSLSKNQFPGLLHHSTSAAAETGLELRFSNRSDTEPWRCRRTDGKKWRCSKNVTHGQKYCERHAHKSRPRSRKPVEIIQPKIVPNDSSYSYTNNFPINNNPISHLPSMASCDPTRGTELLTEERANGTGTMSLWARYQQWQQQQMHSSPPPTKTTMEQNQHSNSRIGEKMQTRGFIDAWSTAAADKRGVMKKISKKECRKIPAVSSLTLSIPGEIEDEEEEEDHDQEHEGNRNVAGRWMNAGMCEGRGTLGGPLGEALCLGISSNTKWPMPSPHKGYNINNTNNNNSISTTTTTSTTSGCSRSSCEDPSSW